MSARLRRLAIPEILGPKLREVCVPVTEEGTTWLCASLRGSEFHGDMERLTKAGTFRARSVSQVYGRARKGRYVAPKALGYELPTAGWPEIAFVGRSNVGKSTLVGTLLGDPRLCRRSKTPGCTTTVNFFETGGTAGCYFVDLPGFGYADRHEDQQRQWRGASSAYLAGRDRIVLRHACLLVDARYGPTRNAADLEALDAFSSHLISHSIVLVKADLATPTDVAASLVDTFHTLHRGRRHSTTIPVVHVVSSKHDFGLQHLRDYLASLVLDVRPQRGERVSYPCEQ